MTRNLALIILLNLLCVYAVMAQTADTVNAPQTAATTFTYQGKLADSSVPASASYDFEFRLYDAVSGGTQQGTTVQKLAVPVANGIFTASLDFGNQFTGADRFLDISVRMAGGGVFTPLTPRQPITSAPHAVRSLSAATADTATTAATATNSTQLGGVAASQFVVTGDTRLTDARPPIAGSPHYIQNGTAQQAASNFNISGTGTIGGDLTANGYLGIGTSAPTSLVTVQQGGTGPGVVATVAGSSTLTGTNTHFLDSFRLGDTITVSGQSARTIISISSDTSLAVASAFPATANNLSYAIAGGTRMVVKGSGNVGIGTANPTATLHVVGDVLFENKWRAETTRVNPGLVDGPPNLIGGFLGTGISGATPGNRVSTGVVGATIGGGGFNGSITMFGLPYNGDRNNRVSDWFGTVVGGWENRAGDDTGAIDSAAFATVGGGRKNIASGSDSTVGGGQDNTGSGSDCTVGGGQGNTASGYHSMLGGGFGNIASGDSSTIGGGDSNNASGGVATVGGGYFNRASGVYSTVSGGFANTAAGDYSFAAGRRAQANHQGTFVWSDSTDADFASTTANQFLIRASGGVGISGNVGIGTTSPAERLHVLGRAIFNVPGNNGFRITPGSDADIGILNVTNAANTVNWLTVSGNGQVIMNGTGNVGIGTTAPDQKLTVNGNADKPGGGSWATFSDERLKTIGGPFTPGLKAVMQLQPLRYEYKADNALGIKSEGEHIGFSAQSVERIIPEAVSKNEQGYRLVNNDPILWTMLNAIKEQQAQIEAQQKQGIQQEKQISTLLTANAALNFRLRVVEKRLPKKRGARR